MTGVDVLDARRDPSDGYKVDVSRGQRIGRVSSEHPPPPSQRVLIAKDTPRIRGSLYTAAL